MITNNFQQNVIKSIEAVSDRIVGEDLRGAPKKITIQKISFFEETVKRKDETKTVLRTRFHYQGEQGKPYIPALTITRFIYKEAWGFPENENAFNGRQMELFFDPNVKLANEVTGGVRLGGLSHIDKQITKKVKSGKSYMFFDVKPILINDQPTPAQPAATLETRVNNAIVALNAISNMAAFDAWLNKASGLIKESEADEIVNSALLSRIEYKREELQGVAS